MIQPREITIADQDGKERRYILSKFPAVEGREIVAKYPISALPKLGDYAVRVLEQRSGVKILVNSPVTKIEDGRVHLKDQIIEADTIDTLQIGVKEALASDTLTTIVSKVAAVGPKSFAMDLPLLENRFQFRRYLETLRQ